MTARSEQNIGNCYAVLKEPNGRLMWFETGFENAVLPGIFLSLKKAHKYAAAADGVVVRCESVTLTDADEPIGRNGRRLKESVRTSRRSKTLSPSPLIPRVDSQ